MCLLLIMVSVFCGCVACIIQGGGTAKVNDELFPMDYFSVLGVSLFNLLTDLDKSPSPSYTARKICSNTLGVLILIE